LIARGGGGLAFLTSEQGGVVGKLG
jgi:hypothetical protein